MAPKKKSTRKVHNTATATVRSKAKAKSKKPAKSKSGSRGRPNSKPTFTLMNDSDIEEMDSLIDGDSDQDLPPPPASEQRKKKKRPRASKSTNKKPKKRQKVSTKKTKKRSKPSKQRQKDDSESDSGSQSPSPTPSPSKRRSKPKRTADSSTNSNSAEANDEPIPFEEVLAALPATMLKKYWRHYKMAPGNRDKQTLIDGLIAKGMTSVFELPPDPAPQKRDYNHNPEIRAPNHPTNWKLPPDQVLDIRMEWSLPNFPGVSLPALRKDFAKDQEAFEISTTAHMEKMLADHTSIRVSKACVSMSLVEGPRVDPKVSTIPDNPRSAHYQEKRRNFKKNKRNKILNRIGTCAADWDHMGIYIYNDGEQAIKRTRNVKIHPFGSFRHYMRANDTTKQHFADIMAIVNELNTEILTLKQNDMNKMSEKMASALPLAQQIQENRAAYRAGAVGYDQYIHTEKELTTLYNRGCLGNPLGPPE